MTKVLTADDSWTDWLCVLKVIDGKAYPIGLVKSLDLKARTCQRLRYHGPSLGEEVGEVNGIALEEFGYDYVVLNKDTAPEWAWDEAEKHGVPVMTTDEFKALVEEEGHEPA